MRLLRDEEIVEELESNSPSIEGVPSQTDWYSKDSPIQASSIDLHIGKICLPIEDKGWLRKIWKKNVDSSSEAEGEEEQILPPGHTAVAVSMEKLKFPSKLAAFGFPPSRMSFKGLLMTNPGHVDPGYSGHMRFTIINMGRKDYVLRRGDPIVTLLLFELDQPVQKDWIARRPGTTEAKNPTVGDLSLLSPQFMDIDARAFRIGSKLVGNAEWKLKVLTPVVAGVAGAIAAFLMTVVNHMILEDPLDDLEHEVIEVREQIDSMNLEERVRELEEIAEGAGK